MKYNVGDKVRVKSLEWYINNHDVYGKIIMGTHMFTTSMAEHCGSIVTIDYVCNDSYQIKEDDELNGWTDDMFEGLAEDTIQPVVFENIVFSSENYADKVELCLGDDYEIVVEGDKTFVQRKKSKYPTTYEECCDVLKIPKDERYIDIDVPLSYNNSLYKFAELLICRNAYWKIADNWKPDWADNYQKKWLITFYQDEINFTSGTNVQFILAFPTSEMRDAFYENFKDLIEKCKDLL